MKIYFLITGCFCLLYYFIICKFTKKWNSTFALFWPIAGTVHLVLWALPPAGMFRTVLYVIILVLWGIFLVIESLIFRAMVKQTNEKVPYLIVLGAQVRGTKITNSLLRRLDAALIYLQKHPETKVIVSGGQGKGEDISEAEAMSGYLECQGIEKERIFLEANSTSTWENLRYSSRIIKDMGQPVAIVTNNFHMYRALLIGKKVGYQKLYGIAASSNPILQINYLVREFFAVIWLKLRK